MTADTRVDDYRQVQPPLLYEAYTASRRRAPGHRLVHIEPGYTETAPFLPAVELDPGESDLTLGHHGEPIGERIIVAGQILDDVGQPALGALVEIWQANAAGRYVHPADTRKGPLDPNFAGAGRCLTDSEGRYRFITVRPGAYPGRSHHNAWRPPHIHFSVLGGSVLSRLVTQMYFPGDPLLDHDPIFLAVPEGARHRLISSLDFELTEPERALGYRFDLVLRGPTATPR